MTEMTVMAMAIRYVQGLGGLQSHVGRTLKLPQSKKLGLARKINGPCQAELVKNLTQRPELLNHRLRSKTTF